jgi:2-polyprenyl-3-methyl-5-hydroxy-6-metoxy-1,4-benzoquinol methylase
MLEDPCIICNNSHFTLLTQKGEWSVYRCNRCGLGVTEPLLEERALVDLYNQTYFLSHYDRGYGKHTPEFKKRIRQEKHRISFIGRSRKKGRLLDIGCGKGYFLYMASRSGYRAEGLDITDINESYIENELGIPMSVQAASSMNYPENTFDIITMWHALEHHRDPVSFLEKCLKWLKQDGDLVIEVPNHECIDAKKQGPDWPNWDLPFHLYHFTPKSLAVLTRKSGLKIIQKKTYHSEYIKRALGSHRMLKPFSRLIARLYTGGSLAVICRKTLRKAKV